MNIDNSIKIFILIFEIIFLVLLYYITVKNKKTIKILGYSSILLSLIYIVWRIIYTLPQTNNLGFIFGVILLALEILAFLHAIVFNAYYSKDIDTRINLQKNVDILPTVDVIISTYNEPIEVLKRTITGCRRINYPKNKVNIYIGDDGKRDSVKELACKYGINYFTRVDNIHAKAGNINNVLSKSNGELILLLDADMIPNKEIINKMLPYFVDPKTGFVQAPQVFYNLDPFQYNLEIGNDIPNEQDFFMRTIEEKRSYYNAVLHVGTNAIFRRSAIEEIGGIPTKSITEDMATGMLIQNAGYKSYFINETLAIGLSVESFEDLIKQRDRWCRGSIQVFKRYNPLKMKGLDFAQKMIYLDSFLYWTFGVQKLFYIIAPLLFLIFRIKIFDATIVDLVLMYIPYFISSVLYTKTVTKKNRTLSWSHVYETALAPHIAFSFLLQFFFNLNVRFNVTPKGIINDKNKYRLVYALPHIILFLLSIIAIIFNVIFIVSNPFNYDAVIINLIWCFYNLLALFVSIFLFLEKNRFRTYERIPSNLKSKCLITSCMRCSECDYCGTIVDISENGALLILKEYCPHYNFLVGKELKVDIENIGEIYCTIVRVSKKDQKYHIGLKFNEIGYKEYSNINYYRFNINQKYLSKYEINKNIDNLYEIIFKIVKGFFIKLFIR